VSTPKPSQDSRTKTLLKIERSLIETVAEVGGGKSPAKIRGEQDDSGNYYFFIDIGQDRIGIKRQVQLAAVLSGIRVTPQVKPIRDLGYFVNKIHMTVHKGRLCYKFMISPLEVSRPKKSA